MEADFYTDFYTDAEGNVIIVYFTQAAERRLVSKRNKGLTY